MVLGAQHMLADGVGAHGAKGVSAQHTGPGWWLVHLIFVSGKERQAGQGRVHPRLLSCECRIGHAQTEAASTAAHRAAQGLGNQLVAEAQAHQGASCRVPLAQGVSGALHPGLGLRHRGHAAGEHPGVGGQCVRRQFAVARGPGAELPTRSHRLQGGDDLLGVVGVALSKRRAVGVHEQHVHAHGAWRLHGTVWGGGKGLEHAGILGSAGPRVLSTSRISAGRAFPPAGLHRPLQILLRTASDAMKQHVAVR